MPHTHSRYQQDLQFIDGRIWCGTSDMIAISSVGSFTTTRIDVGDYGIVAAVGTTGTIGFNITKKILRRTGFFEDIQNMFGSSFGAGLGGPAAGPGSAGTGIPGSAEYQGRPDSMIMPAGTAVGMAALQEITPRTARKLKGWRLRSFDVIYTVAAADPTTFNVRADTIQYTNNVAIPGATSLIADGVNGLTKTFRANPYVINVAPATAQPWLILPDQTVTIEFTIVTPGGGTLSLRGVDLLVDFNFN